METFTTSAQSTILTHNERCNTQLAELCSALVPYPNPIQVCEAIRIQAEMIHDLKMMWDHQSSRVQEVCLFSKVWTFAKLVASS